MASTLSAGRPLDHRSPPGVVSLHTPSWKELALLAFLGAILFAIRLTGAPNLLENEYRVGACVLDALQHGNWLCPHDVLGNTDKPPMLTWLAALASWPGGRVTRFTLYLPTAVATVAIAWLVAVAAGRHFGRRAGFFGGLAYLLSHVGAWQIATARWDGLFSLTVTVAALAAFRAWMRGGGWTVFWLAAAASTLTKGPLGVLLAAFGLGAVVWERRTGRSKPLQGSHAIGIALFLVLTVGWFLLAYRQVGPHLVQNMVWGEFVGHMVQHRVGSRFSKALGDLVWNFAPWSLFTIIASCRAIVKPASNDEERRFERFLICWLLGGWLLFCLSPHSHARLIAPVIPPAAMLAGRELDRLAAALSARTRAVVTATVIAVMLGYLVLEYHHNAYDESQVRRTIALQQLARTVQAGLGDDFPLTYVAGSPFAMQLALNTMRPLVTVDDAVALLRGSAAAFVVAPHLGRLRRALEQDGTPFYELGRASDRGAPFLYLVSNRRALVPVDPTATRVGPLLVTLSGARLGPAWDNVLVFRPAAANGNALIENTASDPQSVRVRTDGARDESRQLAPGEAWRIDLR
jgi:4-amino-4-deoxy-L-arabinose transferase-like glycosyltransferase